jgi:hypothetical protein
MVSNNVSFHVPQEWEPDRLIPLLEILNQDNLRFTSIKDLLDFSESKGLSSRTETQLLARACGLIERDEDDLIGLSNKGIIISKLDQKILPDVIHYLLYTGWDQNNISNNTFFWSYREVSDTLWDYASVDILDVTNIIVEEIRNRTQKVFTGIENYDPNNVSFSPKSIRGIRKWLEALKPPAIEDDYFSRRYFCPPALLLLAIGWVAKSRSSEVGIDFLLTNEHRDQICKLCLLDTSILDKVIDYMLPIFPNIIRPGTSSGTYGRFLHFNKYPQFQDLL